MEPLLAWDESVCCDLLRKMSGAVFPTEYVRMDYIKSHVITKLIQEGTDMDAVNALLCSYGHWADEKPEHIADIERLAGQLKELRAERKQHPTRREELQSQIAAAEAAIIEGLKQCSADELRGHDVPARLAYLLYMEGNYQAAERCLDIITSNYWEDTTYAGGGILAAADVEAMETVEAFTYAYTSQEEQAYLDRILERDENTGVLSPQWKEYLRKMPHTTVYTQAAMEKSWEKLDAAEGADSTPAP